ncbi:MAG: GIY-YIG nuclease family protein [Clostridia bacterium]|jgi:predicted GIY-YIG superfamily endonuclease|nr:GIY-YIG nuclease family protein [Clostridia bacterium]
MKGGLEQMLVDIDKMLSSRVIYGIIDNENKSIYIGLTKNQLITRLGQHLDKNKTVKQYIEKIKPSQLQVEILFQYKRNHKNLQKLLENKEDFFLKKYHKLGYKLINIAKMKKLNLN